MSLSPWAARDKINQQLKWRRLSINDGGKIFVEKELKIIIAMQRDDHLKKLEWQFEEMYRNGELEPLSS